jgi:hypothetical protein
MIKQMQLLTIVKATAQYALQESGVDQHMQFVRLALLVNI